jgi:hypothetical protein
VNGLHREALWRRKSKEGDGDRFNRFSSAIDEFPYLCQLTSLLVGHKNLSLSSVEYRFPDRDSLYIGLYRSVDRWGGATAIRVGTLTEEPCRPRLTRLCEG